jgi:hypothetical protein
MHDDNAFPAEDVFTDQWLCGRPTKVWWHRNVMLAFPGANDRLLILQALEDAMIQYGTTTFYLHVEQIGAHFVTYATADDGRIIYVNVTIGAPILIQLPEGEAAG